MTVNNEVGTVVLTKEQAEYLGRLDKLPRESTLSQLRGISMQSGLSYDEVVRALYVGYTVEKTQEDREADVKSWYEDHRRKRDEALDEGDNFDSHVYAAMLAGCSATLELLDVTIEGVSDNVRD